MFDCPDDVSVTISVPGGEEIAEHTFNPRLGIEGGISIIGTSGVVEPMSRQAILDTIKVELRQKKAEGNDTAFISPGNYGLDFKKETYDVDLDRSVKCSNFIGETIDMVRSLGFEGMMLTGHIGKLVKVAGGIMNTHSREADCRMEIIAAAALREGAGRDELLRILDSLTTEEAYAVLYEAGIAGKVSQRIMQGVMRNLERRSGGRLRIGCIIYSKEYGQLAASELAAEMIEENRNKWNG
jgi:cobalt-precorrin-5B (C1)-methyltransferase